MIHAAPSIDYTSAIPVVYEDYPEGRGEPRYTQKRSRRPKRSTSSRKKSKPAPTCGIGARRNHRIEW